MRRESRQEDMSSDGTLTLIQQEDGDIIVAIAEATDPDGHRRFADVEFTLSGGHSNHTLESLRHLMDAMKRDDEGVPWTVDTRQPLA